MAKNDEQFFNGRRYSRYDGNSYYWNKRRVNESNRSFSMHRDVWEAANGAIPDGFVVHHIDHDPANNDLSNLECLPMADHCRQHMAERNLEFSEAARTAAAAWHQSEEGREWHKELGRKSWENAKEEQFACAHCGESYRAYARSRKRGFCSAACQSAARRASGVDDAPRACTVCEKEFICNRYAKTKTCSKSCWREALSRAKRGCV